jgi:uncharacterized protein YegJ (DUF2314 family)
VACHFDLQVTKFPRERPMMNALFARLWTNWMLAALVLGTLAYPVAMAAVALYAIGQSSPSERSPNFAGLGILLWVIFGVLLAGCLGCVFRQRWAKWLAIVCLLWFAVIGGKSLFTKGWQWSSAFRAIGLPILAWSLWKRPNANFFTDRESSNSAEAQPSEPKVFPSLVHLRTKQRYLEPVIVAKALSSAWNLNLVVQGDDPAVDEESSDGFVSGESPHIHVLLLQPPMTMFIVHNLPHPYWEDSAELAKRIPNLRYAKAVEQHQACLSVDCVHWAGGESEAPESIYRFLGKAICALADDQVLAVLCPEKNRFNLWSEDLDPILSGPSPFSAFEQEVEAAVIQVRTEDTQAAMELARQRWPEFAAAFKDRGESDDEIFLVKAYFAAEDGGEHMWLKVFGLEPEYVHGHLINEPLCRTRLHNGSQVEVPVGDVSDWICRGPDGNPLGNFTQAAIQKACSDGPEKV